MNSSMKVGPVADARAEVVPLGSNASDSGLATTSAAKIFSEKCVEGYGIKARLRARDGLGMMPEVIARLPGNERLLRISVRNFWGTKSRAPPGHFRTGPAVPGRHCAVASSRPTLSDC